MFRREVAMTISLEFRTNSKTSIVCSLSKVVAV
jgi:hypothetical protein